MILALILLMVLNARSLARSYYNAAHWMRALVPAFFLGITLCMSVQIVSTAYYFGTSVWVPDWKCPEFRWLQ